MESRTRSIVLCGLSITLLIVGAAIQLPLGPIPFTLQTLMLLLILLILTPGEGVVAVGGYLLLGLISLPVFAGFRGGPGVLLGPTGGFLIGFFVATLLAGLLRKALGSNAQGSQSENALFEKPQFEDPQRLRAQTQRATLATDIIVIVSVMLTYNILGTIWFMFVMQASLTTALTLCVIPFVVPDVVKAVAACACAQPIRIALGRHPKIFHPSR